MDRYGVFYDPIDLTDEEYEPERSGGRNTRMSTKGNSWKSLGITLPLLKMKNRKKILSITMFETLEESI